MIRLDPNQLHIHMSYSCHSGISFDAAMLRTTQLWKLRHANLNERQIKAVQRRFLLMPNFFLQGKSWDIVGMGFSKVPKVLGDERLVPNPLGVNEWLPLLC